MGCRVSKEIGEEIISKVQAGEKVAEARGRDSASRARHPEKTVSIFPQMQSETL